MKFVSIGAGMLLCLAGVVNWLLPLQRVAHTIWIPMSTPISLVANSNLRTNCSANTSGLYYCCLVFDAAHFDLPDDTPADTFKSPRRIPVQARLEVANRSDKLIETNLNEAVLGSEGGNVVTYMLASFEVKEPDKLSVSFSNSPTLSSEGTGNPRLEIQLSDALYEGGLMAQAVGRKRGIMLVGIGLILVTIGLCLPSRRACWKA